MAEERAAAKELVRLAQEDVQRIRKMGIDVEDAERRAKELLAKAEEARQAMAVAQKEQGDAQAALKSAEEAARIEGLDPGVTDTVVRQQLELRKAAAEQTSSIAQQRIDLANGAQQLVDAAAAAEHDHLQQQAIALSARESASEAAAKEKSAHDELRRCDLLERVLDLRLADKQLVDAKAAVDKHVSLQARRAAALKERAAFAEQRAAMTVPKPGALAPMRRLANELAAAQGALDVGFVVTVSPTKPLQVRIRKDGSPVESTSTAQPLEIEAAADVELDIAKVATVRIRGGGRDAQEKARVLEERWKQDIVPHLAAAGVKDLDGLDAKVVEAQELDVSTKAKDTELNSLRAQISPLTGAAELFRQASDRAETCRAALVDGVPDTLSADLDTLGVDPLAGLRKRRQQLLKNIETARTIAADEANDRLVLRGMLGQVG